MRTLWTFITLVEFNLRNVFKQTGTLWQDEFA